MKQIPAQVLRITDHGSRVTDHWFPHLIRLPLTAMVAAAALAGWALHPAPAAGPWLMAAGVFLLAGGCTALNQWQERDLDARMRRTCRRPLPAGRIAPRTALLVAVSGLGGGLFALAGLGGVPALLGAAAAAIYNGLYTPLKRRTVFAVLVGGLSGALPPLIGWTAAGGAWSDFRGLLPAGLLFLWQVPHFWLFAEKHREDYRRAGLPTPGDLFAPGQRRRLAFAWIAALACATLTLPFTGIIHTPGSLAALLALVLWLAAVSFAANRRADLSPSPLFHSLTIGMAGIVALILLRF
ncbi:MAG: protoheme IX farnesyltransferase [Desulfuromonadales bacterium]